MKCASFFPLFFLALLATLVACSEERNLAPISQKPQQTPVGLLDGMPFAPVLFPTPELKCPNPSNQLVMQLNDRLVQMRENELYSGFKVYTTSVMATYPPPSSEGIESFDTVYSCRLGFGLWNWHSEGSASFNVGGYSYYILLPAFSTESADSGTYYFDSDKVDSILAVSSRRWASSPYDRAGFLVCGYRLQSWTATSTGGSGNLVGFHGIASNDPGKMKRFELECISRTEPDSDHVKYKLRFHFTGGQGTWMGGPGELNIHEGVFEGELEVLSTAWFRRQGYLKSRARGIQLPYTLLQFGNTKSNGETRVKVTNPTHLKE